MSISNWTAADDMADLSDPAIFPVVPRHLIDLIAERATCQTFQPGDVLFEQGLKHAPFFVIETGRVVFFDRNRPETNTYFSTVNDGMFIGDISMFTGAPTIAECRAYEPTRVLKLTSGQLRDLVRENSEAGDLILRTFMARRSWLEGHGYGQIQLLGPASCPSTYGFRDFLGRNQIPFVWRDPESQPEAKAVVDNLSVAKTDFPVLINKGQVHRSPGLKDVARCIGLLPELDDCIYDLVIVGAGPGGLAAAVYGASEGLKTLVLEASAPGGQAGTSSKIENYLGFTTGISGQELARQAVLQARKFGATLCSPVSVASIVCEGDYKTLTLDDGQQVKAHAVVLAMGARYRRLTAENCDRLEGVGLYYAAGHLEAVHCAERPVTVVGGGNSAGQAAVFLSKHASKVSLVIRRADLRATMSEYLIRRIERESNIELVTETEVTALQGDAHLESLELTSHDQTTTIDCAALFVMIGAEPKTDWLTDCCGLDDHGFILTGLEATHHKDFNHHWKRHGQAPDRSPFYLETTRPGIFAIGDARSGSIKRVATSVGEGSMSIPFVHQTLAEVGATA
ncbi:FAD-dependent oxidoreductase [Mucisphaera sp.]|uniref:FAD-dependent oxidoreductase n=1 Tax=Mucisphaera sp. TaxID=2913024 RepID=UPI003D0A8F6B